ncbi:MAG: thioesterase family protein [Actinomycetota bacterium]|nr:thioesterase family protein [Actinomycetota bacterium]
MTTDAAGATFDGQLLPLVWDPVDPDRLRCELTSNMVRPDGALFGGAALAATLSAFEHVTDRPAAYATVQFVSSARFGEHLEARVERVAHGRTVDQLQISAWSDDRLVFSGLGATATRKEGGLTGVGIVPPRVVPPEDCETWGRAAQEAPIGHHRVSEYRSAPILDPDPARPGHMAMWGRVHYGATTTSAKLGYLADMVPIAVSRAAGVLGAGTSLDNTVRIGQHVDSEWILIELEGQLAVGGFGHGVTHLWTREGTLLATGTQTSKLFSFDELQTRLMTGDGGVADG